MKLQELNNLSMKEIFLTYGGLISGHTIFRSGEHGNGYMEKMHVLQDPERMDEIGKRIAELFIDRKDQIDFVVGPVNMGIVLAFSVAKHLKKPFTLTYEEMRSGAGILTGSTHFHRSGSLRKGDRILFVDDLISTGKSLKRNLHFFESSGVQTVGVGVMAMRKIDLSAINVDVRALEFIEFKKFARDKCPLCAKKIPVDAVNIEE